MTAWAVGRWSSASSNDGEVSELRTPAEGSSENSGRAKIKESIDAQYMVYMCGIMPLKNGSVSACMARKTSQTSQQTLR
jgi:hypothetical protein